MTAKALRHRRRQSGRGQHRQPDSVTFDRPEDAANFVIAAFAGCPVAALEAVERRADLVTGPGRNAVLAMLLAASLDHQEAYQ